MWTPQQMAAYNQYIVQQLQGLPNVMPMLPMSLMTGSPQTMLAGPWANLKPPEPTNIGEDNHVDGDNSDDDDDANSEENRTLFCANLDERVTEEILYEVFLQAGPIESVRIPKDGAGKQRTFGFVTYLHASATPYAMHLYQGLELFRKRVTIKFHGTDKLPQIRSKLPFGLEAQFGNRTNLEDDSNMSRLSNSMLTNPFSQDIRHLLDDRKNRHGRHSYHDAKPYERNTNNNNPRRRSDGITDRNYERGMRGNQHHNNHHHNNNRRSEQRSGQRR